MPKNLVSLRFHYLLQSLANAHQLATGLGCRIWGIAGFSVCRSPQDSVFRWPDTNFWPASPTRVRKAILLPCPARQLLTIMKGRLESVVVN